MSQIRSACLDAVSVGIVSGMRTLMMPALLSRASAPAVTRVLSLASVGELVADKLPITPDRTEAASLGARAVSGALSAAAFASRRRGAVIPAAVLGAAAAIGSAHLMVRLRRAAGHRFNVPDPVVGLAEDCLAFAIGHSLASAAEHV